jgi:small subunit ribosomal protein S17
MDQTLHKKVLIGTVSSDRMEKTVTVEVTTFKKHPLYHKRYRWTTKYLSDTGDLTPRLGDMVKIISSRPISKRKRWVVAEVLKESPNAAPAVSKTAATVKPTKRATKKAK